MDIPYIVEKNTHSHLYQWVKTVITAKISSGEWKANHLLPSEAELATSLQVSSGTIRRALDELTADNLLIRHQGKGTFVTSHNSDKFLFHFFKLRHKSKEEDYPQSKIISVKKRRGLKSEIEELKLSKGEFVIEIHRLRTLNRSICIDEKVIISRCLFPSFDEHTDFPNKLYEFYQKEEGVLIYQAIEKIEAINSDRELAKSLNVKLNTALLKITRVAIGTDLKPVELRISHCLTHEYYYLSKLD